jgi:LPPG:FO 2-phospho-L-lactate transferase
VIAVLSGGTGGAKLVRGLAQVVDRGRLVIVGNTGDDFTWWGLHVSPDLDSVTYALAGLLDPVRGFGVRDDTFVCRDAMARLGDPVWFQVGDRDLATHLKRTALLREGASLSAATRAIAGALGVTAQLLPMSDDPVHTELRSPQGWLLLEEFFVRERAAPDVLEIRYRGAEAARPAPGVVRAIRAAEAVVIACSNPLTSIRPILAVPGVVGALEATAAPVLAVSPIVGGAPVSGPAGRLLLAQGLPVSAVSLARLYRPWLDALVLDTQDAGLAAEIDRAGVRPLVADILMPDPGREAAVARTVLAAAGLTP